MFRRPRWEGTPASLCPRGGPCALTMSNSHMSILSYSACLRSLHPDEERGMEQVSAGTSTHACTRAPASPNNPQARHADVFSTDVLVILVPGDFPRLTGLPREGARGDLGGNFRACLAKVRALDESNCPGRSCSSPPRHAPHPQPQS